MTERTLLTAELLEQVKSIELRTRGSVNTLFQGEYKSAFKGQGMEFAEVREYMPGDEVRSIDWNVTARMRRPFVKSYIEERELTVMLVLDVSGSQQFGTSIQFKSDLVSEFAAIISMSAVRNNDRVGMMMFSDIVEHLVPPRKGKRQSLRLVRDLLAVKPAGHGTDFNLILETVKHTLKHRSVVFIISDFLSDSIEQPLRSLAARHDVIAVHVTDPGEYALPDIGIVNFRDPESNVYLQIDTSAKEVRTAYAESVSVDARRREKLFKRLAVDKIEISRVTGVVNPLISFFRSRDNRRRSS